MPKTNTKFTAKFTAKLGKTPIEVSIPVDFANRPTDEVDAFIQNLQNQVSDQLSDLACNAKLKFDNQGDFKKQLKAAVKASSNA
jgi:hypothetical protein